MGKRELVALLSVSSWCLMIAKWLFLEVSCVCLQFVIVVFRYHTHYIACRTYNIVGNLSSWLIYDCLTLPGCVLSGLAIILLKKERCFCYIC